MFKINRYNYVDTTSKLRFAIYARTLETAEKIAEGINSLCEYKIRKRKIFFIKPMFTDIPPYELEQAQFECVEDWKEKMEAKKRLEN